MSINRLGAASVQSGAARSTIGADEKKNGTDSAKTSPNPRDRVEISSQGRALAERAAALREAAPSLGVSRAEEILTRVVEGTFDTPEFVDAVARRVLDSGDL